MVDEAFSLSEVPASAMSAEQVLSAETFFLINR